MIIYPAIDLKNGQCVRLYQGDIKNDTVYNDDPASQARAWVKAGFEWLHIVDLDGAFGGIPVNANTVRAIIRTVTVPVQLGGGIRTMPDIENWLRSGVSRVVLGTAAVRDPELVKRACREFPGKIAIGIDARAGRVAVQGWVEDADIDVLSLALRFEDAGAAAIIYTDIERDGTGRGLNIDATRALARTISIPVIASGGAHSLEDIYAVKAASADGVQGLIVGRAFYDRTIDTGQALAIAAADG
ncbi:MAG: 1-(5-phosphoribosyl)-5-[(5-phosphoribosylamino)methylideneamino]imidazole-4-carboxamide isomerase [Alphaproteobacteria bacterium]